MDDSLVQLHRHRESPGQLEYLAAVVIAVFNGAAGFAAEYANAFDAAREAGDHKAVLRYLQGLADLMWGAEQALARRKMAEEKRNRQREAIRRAARRNAEYGDYEEDLR